MRRSIQTLDPSVVSKIAAGEVVERPASAVKELVENALDADARSITVELVEGGRDLIRVVDDGVGVPRGEIPLAVQSHSTSKLVDADDLFRVRSYGFRGEALWAIAGVSQFRLQSRPADQEDGGFVEVDHGKGGPVGECGCPAGTQIEVRQLFASVPARRKYLKSRHTELGHTVDALQRLALARPDVALRLIHNDRSVFERPAHQDRRETVAALFGSQVARALLPIGHASSDLRIDGFVADPSVSRPNARGQYFFVNGRAFRDRSLSHAVSEGFRGLLTTGRYPIVFVFIELAPEEVDVNVHPAKLEVRFRDPHRVYSGLLSAIRAPLLSGDLVARGSLGPDRFRTPAGSEDSWSNATTRARVNQEFALSKSGGHPAENGLSFSAPLSRPISRSDSDERRFDPFQEVAALESTVGVAVPAGPNPHLSAANPDFCPPRVSDPDLGMDDAFQSADRPSARPSAEPKRVFQLHNTYLVVETGEGMLLMDQHALHERILFEELRDQLANATLEVQDLLIPEPVELGGVQAGLILDCRELLAGMGIRVDEFGDGCVLVRSLPRLLGRLGPTRALELVAGHLENSGQFPDRDALLARLLALLACKAAVKAGDRLHPDEIEALVAQRDRVANSHHCPHGRPAILQFTLADLERQFRRT